MVLSYLQIDAKSWFGLFATNAIIDFFKAIASLRSNPCRYCACRNDVEETLH